MGVPTSVGDMIYTSAGQSARIISINYSTGAVTVDNSISWTLGDGITTVNYSGAAPDLGYAEYSGSAPTPPHHTGIGYNRHGGGIGYNRHGGGMH